MIQVRKGCVSFCIFLINVQKKEKRTLFDSLNNKLYMLIEILQVVNFKIRSNTASKVAWDSLQLRMRQLTGRDDENNNKLTNFEETREMDWKKLFSKIFLTEESLFLVQRDKTNKCQFHNEKLWISSWQFNKNYYHGKIL